MKESDTLKSHDKKVPNEPNKSEMGWCKTNHVARPAISGVDGVNVENLQVFVQGLAITYKHVMKYEANTFLMIGPPNISC